MMWGLPAPGLVIGLMIGPASRIRRQSALWAEFTYPFEINTFHFQLL